MKYWLYEDIETGEYYVVQAATEGKAFAILEEVFGEQAMSFEFCRETWEDEIDEMGWDVF